MSYSPAPPKQMKQKDYFQPMGQRDKVPLWTDEHTEQVKYGVVQGIGWGLIFFVVMCCGYDSIPNIPEGPQCLGLGTYKMCSESCEDCHKQYHDHYLKAWRKVK